MQKEAFEDIPHPLMIKEKSVRKTTSYSFFYDQISSIYSVVCMILDKLLDLSKL